MLEAVTARNGSGTRRGFCTAVLCALALLTPAGSSRAASPSVNESSQLEYRVKAAFLYHLARFVEWPSERERGPIVIGVLGKDPFGSILDSTVQGKTVSGRRLTVRRLDAVSEARSCHLVFVSSDQRRNLGAVLDQLESSSVLTVSELESFIEEGGMINFAIDEDRVVLDINLDSARRAGLDISSQVLKVARNVKYDRRAAR